MPRAEFSRTTNATVFLRANGKCEGCGARLKVGESEYDHVLPCALGGTNEPENCKLLCKVCHGAKSGDDVRRIRKSDRQRDKHNGAWKATSRPIPGSKRSGWKKLMNGKVVRR